MFGIHRQFHGRASDTSIIVEQKRRKGKRGDMRGNVEAAGGQVLLEADAMYAATRSAYKGEPYVRRVTVSRKGRTDRDETQEAFVIQSRLPNQPRRASPPTRIPRTALAAPSERPKESVNTATPNI